MTGRLEAMWRRQLARREQIVRWQPTPTDQLLHAVIKGSYRVEERTARRPSVLRAHPEVGYQLRVATSQDGFSATSLGRFGPPGASIPDYFDPRPGVVGLVLEHDRYLQRGAWRLCDDAGTLLYDCREGKSP
jgi:hypothetical protein